MAEQMAGLNKEYGYKLSTTEKKWTGKYWIDGRKIWEKVYEIPNVSAGSTVTIASVPDIIPINYSGFAFFNSAKTSILPPIYPDMNVSSSKVTGVSTIYYSGSSGNISLAAGSSRTLYGGYLIVEYIDAT